MPDPLNSDHPARGIPPLADLVAAIDDATAPHRWKPSPAVANKIALNAAHVAYTAGRHAAVAELLTTEQAAHALGVGMPHVRTLAERFGVGWQISRGVWLFRPEEVEAMRERNTARGRPRREDGAG